MKATFTLTVTLNCGKMLLTNGCEKLGFYFKLKTFGNQKFLSTDGMTEEHFT